MKKLGMLMLVVVVSAVAAKGGEVEALRNTSGAGLSTVQSSIAGLEKGCYHYNGNQPYTGPGFVNVHDGSGCQQQPGQYVPQPGPGQYVPQPGPGHVAPQPGYGHQPLPQMYPQTYKSGEYAFPGDARRAMEEMASALRGIGAVILEKRYEEWSFTIVYQLPYAIEMQYYASGDYNLGDAQYAMEDTAQALRRAGALVLEKRRAMRGYNITFVASSRLQPHQYISGNYMFNGDAKRAAAETAANLAANGMIVLEKNVSGTRFTITYLTPGFL